MQNTGNLSRPKTHAQKAIQLYFISMMMALHSMLLVRKSNLYITFQALCLWLPTNG